MALKCIIHDSLSFQGKTTRNTDKSSTIAHQTLTFSFFLTFFCMVLYFFSMSDMASVWCVARTGVTTVPPMADNTAGEEGNEGEEEEVDSFSRLPGKEVARSKRGEAGIKKNKQSIRLFITTVKTVMFNCIDNERRLES